MSLPERYKKVRVKQRGADPHQQLVIVDVPMPMPRPYEIVVKNHYAGVNDTDVGRMMGLDDWSHPVPFDFGVEALGEVVAIGDKVRDYAVGDSVISALPGNGYGEYTVIDQNFVARVPALDPKYVGVFISGTTAKIALEFVANIQSTETVMVTGALSASGHFAVQLAKMQGCHVIGTCANAHEASILTHLGVDQVLDRSADDVAQVLTDEYHDMINVVFDVIGGPILAACIKNAAPRARIVLNAALHQQQNGHTPPADLYQRLIAHSIALVGFSLSDYANAVPIESLKLLDKLQLGILHSLVDPTEFSGIDTVPDAIAHMMSGASRGKVIVQL
ncbi:MAG: zinc-binding dehydrogenase [Anaerolineae bacterium]